MNKKDLIDKNEILKNRVEVLGLELYEYKKRAGKICKICNMKKPLEEFSPNRTSPDGYQCICKKCFNEKYNK